MFPFWIELSMTSWMQMAALAVVSVLGFWNFVVAPGRGA